MLLPSALTLLTNLTKEGAVMNNPTLSSLKDKFGEGTLKLILLGIFTFGIYFFIWLAERRKAMDELAGKEVFDVKLMIAAALASGFSTLFTVVSAAMNSHWIDPFSLIYGILFIVISFKVATFFELYIAKEFKIDVKFNKFLLILFNIMYLNYKINELPKIEEKANLLKA